MKTNDKKPTKEEILAKHGYKCAIDVKDKDKFIEAFVNPLLEAMDEWAEIYHKEKLKEELMPCDKCRYDGLQQYPDTCQDCGGKEFSPLQ